MFNKTATPPPPPRTPNNKNLGDYHDLYFQSHTSLLPDVFENFRNKRIENIRKIAIGKGDDYTTGCLLDYPYFKDSYKMIAADLSKQHALDADPRPNQQINFTANLDRVGNTRIYFILEEAKETILDFSKGAAKVL